MFYGDEVDCCCCVVVLCRPWPALSVDSAAEKHTGQHLSGNFWGSEESAEPRTLDRKVSGSILAGAVGEFSAPESTFCADFYFRTFFTEINTEVLFY